MSAKDLIDLNDKDLIKVILKNLKSTKKKVRLWQKLTSMHKVNVGRVDTIDFIENKVLLRPCHDQGFSLAPIPYVYFHSHHRTTLFKTSIRDRGQFRLEIRIPQFVKIQEGRTEERRSLGKSSQYSAKVNLDGRGLELKVQVLDISLKGVGLGVPRILFEFAEKGAIVTLSSDNVPFLHKKTAVLRNKIDLNKGNKDSTSSGVFSYRLGLEILDPDELNDLL